MNTEQASVALDILSACRELALATLMEDGNTQSDTVCFVHQGFDVYFATGRDSHKIANILRVSQVSFCLYKRYARWQEIKALSVHAFASIVPGESAEHALAVRLLEDRFPGSWARAPEYGQHRTTIVKLAPWAMQILDYSRGFGHGEMVTVGASHE